MICIPKIMLLIQLISMHMRVSDMMKDISELKDIKKPSIFKNKHGSYSNTIYTFDIETTSLFEIDGKWQLFDKSISSKQYKKIDKSVVCYHCQFGIEDQVYSFRYISEFEDVLKKISNPLLCKTIWIHNMAYEMAFLIPILRKYTINNLTARQSHKPIAFRIEELNIEFRCSLRLTELGLEKCGEQYTDVKKAVGDLDYNISRSPLTKLTEKELYYCEMDCVVLYHTIRYFLNKYGSIKQIPLTQTGETRRAFKKVVPPEHYTLTRRMIPELEEFKMLNNAFWGAIVHGNRLYVGEYLNNIHSIDIASSYPFVMTTEKYPMERFREIKVSNIKNYNPDHYAFMYDVEFFNIESNLYNNFISYSKCREVLKAGVDNGRICCASHIRLTCTDIDFEMIKKAYSYDSYKIKKVRVAKKDYLPSYMVQFILHCYGQKTTLKGVEGQEEIYMKYKQMVNCLYGACCTDLVRSSVVFDSEKLWVCPPLTDEIKKEKLDEMKKSKQLFVYSWGCWVTAYARRNLFERIIECNVTKKGVKYSLDADVVYYDTDSLKMKNFEVYKEYFEDYNAKCIKKMNDCAKIHGFDFNMYQPKDKHGIRHPLGIYDFNDGDYEEFCTLGSKRYVYRDSEDHELHISISGVNKKAGVKLLRS